MFSRQLAILLESGIDIVTALELFKTQAGNKVFKDTIGEIIADLRGGTSFSDALVNSLKFFRRCIAAPWPPVSRAATWIWF